MKWILALLCVSLLLSSCGDEEGTIVPAPEPETPLSQGNACPEDGCEEIGVGEVIRDEKTDGNWTEALKCKPIPEVEVLQDPEIIVSLDGLTVRLKDRAGDYERVFPFGAGAISDETGESLTPTSTHLPEGVYHTRTDMPAVQDNPTLENALWAWNYSCRMWGKELPYFAGLPFVRIEGTSRAVYGFHGPIDRFTQANGGSLFRGYVSQGCMRMAPEDIVELWARIQGHKVPVRIQKALDRNAEGRVVDIENNWLLSECQEDSDCSLEESFCRQNPYSGRGFCTIPCDRLCPDRPGYPVTMCIHDPDNAERGICVPQSTVTNNHCKRFGGFASSAQQAFQNPERVREVCAPSPHGWVGSLCTSPEDCTAGTCTQIVTGDTTTGVCAEACEQFCADVEGAPETYCVTLPTEETTEEGSEIVEADLCTSRCANDGDCPGGFTCQSTPRANNPEVSKKACVPLSE